MWGWAGWGEQVCTRIPENSKLCSKDSTGMSGLGLRADLCAQGQMRQEEPHLLPFPFTSSVL